VFKLGIIFENLKRSSLSVFQLNQRPVHLMKFTPCIDKCTSEGSYCEGCGRSHQEIADTKKLVLSIVDFIKTQHYENSEDFLNVINKSVLKRLPKAD